MKYLAIISLFVFSACGMFGEDEEKKPVERYQWVQGPIQHPVTGRNCTKGYCEGRPLKDGADSGCNSSESKCGIIR